MLPAELEHLVEDVVDKKCERQNIELKRASFGNQRKIQDELWIVERAVWDDFDQNALD